MWMRLWMFPWFVLFLYGVERLGTFFSDSPWFFVLLTLFSPVVLLHLGSLTPDIPLVSTYVAGIAGVCTTRSRKWALVAGCSVLFRYSGLTVIPLILGWSLLFGYFREGIKLSFVACVPFLMLTCHDIWAYGQSHFLQMIVFQSSESSPLLPKMISLLAMLSGAVVLPMGSTVRKSLVLLMMSFGIGFALFPYVHHIMDVFWVSTGAFLFLNTVRYKGKKELALSLWVVGGMLFLSQLRFAAARYWLPFFFPVLLAIIHGKKFRVKMIMLCMTSILSIFLMIDDYRFACAHRDAALRILQKSTSGSFAGHWGWQHYLQESKWIPVEDDMLLTKDMMFAHINTAWPQEVQGCRTLQEEFSSQSFWGPRVHTYQGKANIHSSHIAGLGMVFSPWSFGSDPYVHVQLFRACP
jgi:hypothetical protein